MAFYDVGGMRNGTLLPGDIIIDDPSYAVSHCGMVYDKSNFIHAKNEAGVHLTLHDNWGKNADIYRLTNRDGKKIANLVKIAKEIENSGKTPGKTVYGPGRAFASIFGNSQPGPDLFKRLEKYRENFQTHQTVIKHVYCSELVIVCYQLACIGDDLKAKTVNSKDPMFIALDGKRAWPSTLRTWLLASPNFFHVGSYRK